MYYCSINIKRQSDHSGLRPVTSSPVSFNSLTSNFIKFKQYESKLFIDRSLFCTKFHRERTCSEIHLNVTIYIVWSRKEVFETIGIQLAISNLLNFVGMSYSQGPHLVVFLHPFLFRIVSREPLMPMRINTFERKA